MPTLLCVVLFCKESIVVIIFFVISVVEVCFDYGGLYVVTMVVCMFCMFVLICVLFLIFELVLMYVV